MPHKPLSVHRWEVTVPMKRALTICTVDELSSLLADLAFV